MSTKLAFLPGSVANVVLAVVLLVGVVASAVVGHRDQAILLGVILVVAIGSAWRARVRPVTALYRINAREYADEGDRFLARTGFAGVGMVALSVTTLELVSTSIFALPFAPIALVQFLVFVAAWAIANVVAIRRH